MTVGIFKCHFTLKLGRSQIFVIGKETNIFNAEVVKRMKTRQYSLIDLIQIIGIIMFHFAD